jgi:hypothetical protein
MKSAAGKDEANFTTAPRMGAGSWIVLVVLLLLLAATAAVTYLGWTVGDDVALPSSTYVAMAFGIVFSLGVGIGLMALLFYSNRHGYDEPPVLTAPKDNSANVDCGSNTP